MRPMADHGSSNKAILYALLANFGIAVSKLLAALYTASGSMLAEAIHSFSDCANPPISTVAIDVPAMARTVIDRMVTLIESNLRHERPDDITHDHIQFQVMPRTSTLAA